MTMEERTFIPEITVEEVGEAKVGLRSDEVVIGLAPAFLKYQNKYHLTMLIINNLVHGNWVKFIFQLLN